MTDQLRIEYVIQRRRDGEDDFTDVGFGSSGAWSDVETCAGMVLADIQHDAWEISDGMPDPRELGGDQR